MKTVITHFYNEEYLLPWWLNHHKKYFDMGLLINYQSTDRSVEICKDICPHWQVVDSVNTEFNAECCDLEIMFYERQISGWRIALTTTEFLVGDVNKLTNDAITDRTQHLIPGIRFTKWDPLGILDTNKPLWEQIKTGINYNDDPLARQCRSLHKFNDIYYPTGRHFTPYTTEDAMIFHYANCIIGAPMLKRRLQIQHKIPKEDKQKDLGKHHYYDQNGLTFHRAYKLHHFFLSLGETDCSNLMAKVI